MRKKKRWWALVPLVPLAAVATWAVHSCVDRRALRRELANWRQVGGQITIEALAPSAPPGEANAAPVYLRVFQGARDLCERDARMLADPWRAKELELLVSSHPDLYTGLEKASRMPRCVWPTKYDALADDHIAYVYSAKLPSQLLIADAIVRARGGDTEGAAASLTNALILSERLTVDPFWLNFNAHVALDRDILRALERIFRTRELPSERILPHLTERDYASKVQKVLLAHGALMLTRLEQRRLLEPELPGYLPGWAVRPHIQRIVARSLRMLRQYISCLDRRPWYSAAISLSECTEVTFAPTAGAGSLFLAGAEAEALAELARQAIELRLYRAKHGAYPATFAAGADPFDGKPLRYEREGDGFTLWSIGQARPIKWRWQ